MKSASLLLLVCACTSDPSPVQLTVSPDPAKVLTCSTAQFTASVDATWAASPGTIDATGLYTSPITMQPATATVTATAIADPAVSATAQVALATAFPGAPSALPGAPGSTGALGTVGVFQHAIAARGTRAYAVWPVNPAGGSTVTLQIARSDTGGASWQATAPAFAAALKPGTDTSQSWVECAAVAIDAGNPDVIYATARISGGNALGAALSRPDDPVLVFAVSSDGGASFTQRVLRAGVPVGYCADLVSPAPDTVVIGDPVDQCGKDIWVWSDTARGAGFASGTGGASGYVAHGVTAGLDAIDGRACGTPDKIDVEQNGTTAFGGEATEAPRLFSDGAGRVCITYIADTTAKPGPPIHAYVQCSDDLGATFSPLAALDPTAAAGTTHSQATGALGPGDAAAAAWVRSLDTTNQTAHLFVATSANGGRSFGAPQQLATAGSVLNPSLMYDAAGALWLAYRVFDGTTDRIFVDKSCDGGTTWSGAVEVGDAALKWPVLLPGLRLAASAEAEVDVFGLTP